MRAMLLPVLTVALLIGSGPASAQTTTTPPSKPTATAVPEPIPLPAALSAEVMRYVGGDGDNIPEPGERLQVFVALRNIGDKKATDVTGRLAIASGDVTIIDGTSSWPDIPAGGAAESQTPFVIQIAADAAREKACPGLPVPLPIGSSEPGAAGGGSGSSGTGNTSSGTVSTPSAIATVAPEVTATTAPGTPEPADFPVAFEAIVRVKASGDTFDTGFGSGVACAVDTILPSTPVSPGAQGAEKGTPLADLVARATSTPAGDAVLVIVVVALAAAAIALRRRLMA